MTNPILFANNASTTLAGAIGPSAATLSVAPGAGALFPSPGAGQYFLGTLQDAATGEINEIVKVTSRTGDVMTVVRAQEGTTALNWLAGDLFANLWTAGSASSLFTYAQGNLIAFVLLTDQQASGTNAGAAVNNGWVQRNLQTVKADPLNLVGAGYITLSANSIVLLPGTYRIQAKGQCDANHHMIGLFNHVGGALIQSGSSENCVTSTAGNPQWTTSSVDAVVTVASGTMTIDVNHYASGLYNGTPAGGDLGRAVGAAGTPETYTQVCVYKIS